MSFLSPLWLVLVAGAAVPLVLHLMRRRIQARVDFPAVRYLARAERENVRQIKMRNLLLMLLRIACVLALALAAARPLGNLLGAGHVPTALAIVLDNSLSTSAVVNGTPQLAVLRDHALRAAQRATSGDRVWLVTVDGKVIGGSLDGIRTAIEQTDAFNGAGNLSAAMTRAQGLVSGSGLAARQIVVITDGQTTAWTDPPRFGDTHVSVLLGGGDAPRNHAVIEADVRPSRWTPRGAVIARARVADSATYRIMLGTTRLASGTVRGADEVVSQAAPDESGWLRGLIELAPDELRGDDTRHFAVWVGRPPAVSVDPAAGPFARTAVEALRTTQRVTTGNAVIVAEADRVTSLPALILPPNDRVRIGAANRALERLGVPWRYGSERGDVVTVRSQYVDGAQVNRRFQLNEQPGAVSDTLATAGGDPWIVAGPQYVLLGSPLDPDATDLPIRAEFVPWLGDMFGQRLAGDASVTLNAAPGAAVRLPSGTDGLTDASGQVIRLAAGGGATALAPARPGVYLMQRGADTVGALVVNVEPEESDLARLSAEALADRVSGDHVLVTADVPQWDGSLFNAGTRRPLQVPLIVLALVLLLAEMVIVRRYEHATATA